MTIRWRLAVLLVQLAVILAATKYVTGDLLSQATWFASLVALVLNTQLLEPFFARPVDTLANSSVGLILYGLSSKKVAAPGWHGLAVGLVLAAVLATFALLFGANRRDGKPAQVARTARMLSRGATAPAIYSAVFWLALLDYADPIAPGFWTLGAVWLVIFILGTVDWQGAWSSATGGPVFSTAEGMIGPSRLLIAAPECPKPGTAVSLETGGITTDAIVVSRIPRATDVWAELQVGDPQMCERFLSASGIKLTPLADSSTTLCGVVDATSTHTSLVFSPVSPMQIGQVVAVPHNQTEVLYQLSAAEVERSTVPRGAHLTVKARARQLGIFDQQNLSLLQHPWVPTPGAPVLQPSPARAECETSDERMLLGHVIGTEIPIFLDCEALCEGHVAILGMTRMGKTTLALRLARHLSRRRSVIVLDQTGEYCGHHGFAVYDSETHDSTEGVSVFEPAPGQPIPDEGLSHLKHVVNRAFAEYTETGDPFPRVLVVDEAHQFVPEPAMLGFGSPGRDSAITFGMYTMQIRKYGITIILISQRTAVVAKSALSQCENLIAFKSVDRTGVEYLEAILGPDIGDLLPVLEQGQAVVFGPAVSSEAAVGIEVTTGVTADS